MRRRRGVSLVELLMAMAFFSTLLVMALGILHWALRGSQVQQANTRAAFLAQAKMEELFCQARPESGKGDFAGEQREFHWETQVAPLAGEFLQLKVTVRGPAGCELTLQSQRRVGLRELVYAEEGRLRQSSEDYREATPLKVEAGGDFSLSPDGATVAYVGQHEGKPQIFLRRLDGSDSPRLLLEHPSGAQEPSFSPDGKSLAFTAQDGGFSQIFVADLKSRLYENKSRSSHHDGSPGWSGDGKSLLFVRDSSSIVLQQGLTQTVLVEGEGWNTAPCLSPDGKSLVFMSNRDGNPEIYLKKLAGGSPQRLTNDPGYDTLPRFSPDGSRILFLSNRDGQERLYTMNPDGSRVETITSEGRPTRPVWLR